MKKKGPRARQRNRRYDPLIDLNYLERIRLVASPKGQIFIARLFLVPNYRLFADLDIVIEGAENIPADETVIFAMNHTDRFNYWPFQFKLWRKGLPFTTVWVKGKYYRNRALGKILDGCNLIPVPSMGYVIEEFYRKRFGRKMDRNEYRVVRDVVDGTRDPGESARELAGSTAGYFGEDFIAYLRDYHEKLMDRVAELSREALFELGLNLIIFPEGTRSQKLGEGRSGIAQLALATGKTIVPVGCSHSDKVYTGSLPVAKSGRIVYRVGKPLTPAGDLRDYRIDEPFRLFSRESQAKYRDRFEGATRLVMERINALVDDEYRR